VPPSGSAGGGSTTADSSVARWQPPAWAVVPTLPLSMDLVRGAEIIQSLDVSRKRAYVLGRSKLEADLVVPHDSVSRRHAALVHGAQGANGEHTVHIIDLGSTKGTYIDRGSGWKRLPPKAPTLLPPRGRVRLGDCSTLLVRPAAGGRASEAGSTQAAEDAPLFEGLLQSTVIVGPPQAPQGRLDRDAAPSQAQPTAANEEQANFDQFVAALPGSNGIGGGTEGQGEEGEGDLSNKQISNSDLRASLLPFLTKRTEVEDKKEEKKKKQKKRKMARGLDDSDDESDGEPAPPMVLDKSSADAAAGFVLRKQKTKVKSKSDSSSKSLKIKF